MKRSKVFLINAIILSVTSIVIQAIDVWFKVYITNLAGPQAMGLFQLIISVYTFALTLALSGINLAATRLVAEEVGKSNGNVSAALKSSLIYATVFGFFSAFLLFVLSDFIAKNWLMNQHTEPSLKLLALTLPFISITAVINSYFIAVRRVIKSASTNFLDQLLKTLIAVFIFTRFKFTDIETACVCIVLSALISEVLSFIYSCIQFKIDITKHRTKKIKTNDNVTKRMLKIALPMAFSAYVRSGLLSLEHLLIPVSLKKYGSSYADALSVYGIIHGIVLPILLFPSAIIGAFSGMLIPEVSENMASKGKLKDKNTKHSITDIRTNYIIKRVYQITLTFALPVCAVFVFFSKEIVLLTSNPSADTAFYIKLLALMVPIMYLDSVTDSFLKALNEQVNSMIYNILDSTICVIMVITLLPVWGIKGYIVVLYLSEIFNTALSVMRLIKVANFKFELMRWVVYPTLSALAAVFLSKNIIYALINVQNKFSAIILLSAFVLIYIIILIVSKTVKRDDIDWIVSFFKKDNNDLTKTCDVGNI